MAGIRSSGTWGSALTAGEFAAIRSVGFEPGGQVFGAAVYSAGSASGYVLPRDAGVIRRPVSRPGRSPGVRAGRRGSVRPARPDDEPGAAHGRRPDDDRGRRAWRARGGRRPAVPGLVPPRRAEVHRPGHRGPRAGCRTRATGAVHCAGPGGFCQADHGGLGAVGPGTG